MFLSPMTIGRARFDSARMWVMGVVNVTPDSFSDGGKFLDVHAAIAEGKRLIAEGADLIDVGGESTRPGAQPVDAATEIERVLPVVKQLAKGSVPVSIDTVKGEVAEAALAAGALVVNDVTGGRDPRLLAATARAQATLIVGHLRGTPRDMQQGIAFVNLIDEIVKELADSIARARQAGVTSLIADPGIGFGKRLDNNLELLARGGELSSRLGVPVMLGPSRKSFLGELTGRAAPDRLAATLGAIAMAAAHGADFVRVHDVAAARDALAVVDAVTRRG